MEIDAYLYLMGQLVPVIARALPGDVADATALVAGLGPSVGAVLHNMAHLGFNLRHVLFHGFD